MWPLHLNSGKKRFSPWQTPQRAASQNGPNPCVKNQAGQDDNQKVILINRLAQKDSFYCTPSSPNIRDSTYAAALCGTSPTEMACHRRISQPIEKPVGGLVDACGGGNRSG
jgi:hypothetical protein